MSYIDGYLVPVPHANKDAYIALAKKTGAVLLDYGALSVTESWIDQEGDDAKFHATDARENLSTRTPDMVTSFPGAIKAGPDEAVVLSITLWPDKATRDEGLEKAMADPRMDVGDIDPVFDGRRLIASGFTPIVEL